MQVIEAGMASMHRANEQVFLVAHGVYRPPLPPI